MLITTSGKNHGEWKGWIVIVACLTLLVVGCSPTVNTAHSNVIVPAPNSGQAVPAVKREYSPAGLDAGYRFTSGSSAPDIPFELNANKIYLSVRVNNQVPLSFILDSGAAFDVVDEERARTLGVKSSDPSVVRGAGEGSVRIAVGTGISLSLPGLEIVKPTITILPINSSISESEGRAVDGLLGYDFFKEFVVEIDYANQRVNVFEPQTYRYAGPGEIIQLQENQGHTFINTTLAFADGRRVQAKLLLDTGARMALTLNTPFVDGQRLLATTPQIINSITSIGVGGASPSAVARIKSLRLGQLTIKNPVAAFSRATSGVLAGSDFDGIIGAEILRRFKVIIDYSRQQMILEPNERLNGPYEYDMSGLVVTAERPDFRTYKIYRVLDGSPAAACGLRKGDEITALNGQPAANFTLEQIRQKFTKGAGVEYKLSVRRNKQLLSVVLKLRKLI
jgi:predicted aspartyl protease